MLKTNIKNNNNRKVINWIVEQKIFCILSAAISFLST